MSLSNSSLLRPPWLRLTAERLLLERTSGSSCFQFCPFGLMSPWKRLKAFIVLVKTLFLSTPLLYYTGGNSALFSTQLCQKACFTIFLNQIYVCTVRRWNSPLRENGGGSSWTVHDTLSILKCFIRIIALNQRILFNTIY